MGANGSGMASHLILYTKPDCELCHEAKAALLPLSRELTFELVEIDITTDAALYDAFHEEIPVGFLDGHKLFKYRVDPAHIRRRWHKRRGWRLGGWLSALRCQPR
jgi:glutaredoxin